MNAPSASAIFLADSSSTVSSGIDRAQGIQQIQRDIAKNLARFKGHTVKVKLRDTYWFSNEYSNSPAMGGLKLANSYARIPISKPLSGYLIAIITGEGGLFQGLPELADSCDLTLQIDCDPNPLQLCALLLEEIRNTEDYPCDYMARRKIIDQAIGKFQAANPEIGGSVARAIFRQFDGYITGMERNVFSSPERFAQFKRCQNHPVQQVCLNYFSKQAMTTLAETLRAHGATVRFINMSNVCEYPMDFYQVNPYCDGDSIAGITPSMYVQQLPFSDDAICASSQLFGFQYFTATATIPEMANALYACAINRRKEVLSNLALANRNAAFFWLLGGTRIAKLTDLQLSTMIFQFFAENSMAQEHDWILRLTAARLTSREVQELKDRTEAIKSLYLQSHPTSTQQPSLLIKILDRIAEESMQTETTQPVAAATSKSE